MKGNMQAKLFQNTLEKKDVTFICFWFGFVFY